MGPTDPESETGRRWWSPQAILSFPFACNCERERVTRSIYLFTNLFLNWWFLFLEENGALAHEIYILLDDALKSEGELVIEFLI